jgi:hypothetical protein
MDGLVLVLAIILNPRPKKAVQRGEQKSRDGSDHDGGTARVTTATGGHDDKERSAQENHITPITV